MLQVGGDGCSCGTPRGAQLDHGMLEGAGNFLLGWGKSQRNRAQLLFLFSCWITLVFLLHDLPMHSQPPCTPFPAPLHPGRSSPARGLSLWLSAVLPAPSWNGKQPKQAEIPEPAIHPLLVWTQDVSKLPPFYFYPHCHPPLRGRSIIPLLLFSLQKWDIVSSFFDLKAKNSYRKLFSRCFTV